MKVFSSRFLTFCLRCSMFYLLICFLVTCSLFLVTPVRALSGVGSAVTQVATGTQITVSGRHSPGAEIIVVHEPTGKVVASGLDTGTGIFSLTFTATSSQLGGLVVLAVDPADQTNDISVPNGGLSDRLFPPSLVYDEENSNDIDSVTVAGYTFPGAQVTVKLVDENGLEVTGSDTAISDGGWSVLFSPLSPGTYTATATSRLGLQESASSVELEIIITDPSFLPQPVSDTFQNVSDVVDNVAQAIIPDAVKDTIKQVSPQAEQVAETVTPVASAGILTQILLAARDLLYFLLQGGIALMQYFGFWRKRFPWGVVYDAFTKQPLNLATVRLFAAPTAENPRKRLVETDVSSRSGVFSFEAEPGEYLIEIRKPGYIFPSVIVTGQTDGEYSNVYRGEVFRINQQQVVSVSVPIDPDQISKLTLRFKLSRFLRERMYMFTIMMLISGLVMSLIAVIGGERGLNGFFVLFYSGVLIAQWYIYQKKSKSWGHVTGEDGKPIGGIQLNLMDPQFNKLVQRRVSDEEGKYQFVVPAGRYQIKVENRDYDFVTTNKKVYQGQEILVEGDKPKLLALPIIVKKNNP